MASEKKKNKYLMWGLLAAAALVAFVLLKKSSTSKPATSSTSSNLASLTGLIGGTIRSVGDITNAVRDAFKSPSAQTEIPTGGNTLPGSPTFGPTLENGNLYV